MAKRDAAITSKIMSAVRSKDTKPELALRRALHARGLRYRLHDRRLPGRPDLVFRSAGLVVFVDGDFWHGAGWRERGHESLAEQFPSRKEWWVKKLQRNMERDAEVNAELRGMGWEVIRVFESRVRTDLQEVVESIESTVRERRRPGQGVTTVTSCGG